MAFLAGLWGAALRGRACPSTGVMFLKYIRQFAIILAFSLAGEMLSLLIPLPVPGSIYGIVLLFGALTAGIIPLDAIRDTGRFLLEIMPVMFIPAAAGLIDLWPQLKASWPSYAVLLTVSTFAVMIVSGRVTQRVIRREKSRHE